MMGVEGWVGEDGWGGWVGAWEDWCTASAM